MDSGLNHIESMYLSYSGLLEEFSEDIIRQQVRFFIQGMYGIFEKSESGVRGAAG